MKNSKIIRSIICLVIVAMIAILPMTAMAASKAYILKVNTDNVHMRSGSGASSTVIATLHKGTKLLYLGTKAGQLCKVATTGGKIGYVYKPYLSTYGVVNKSKVYKLSSAGALYNSKGRKLCSLKSGAYVYVISKSGAQAFVRTTTGKTGYISTNYLKKAF